MTIMQPSMKITVVFVGQDEQTRHKYTVFSNSMDFETVASEVAEFIATASPDDNARGPEAWITGMEIERTR